MGDFFKELKRRHVVRVGLAYLVVAWLVLQLVNNIVSPLRLPEWTPTFVVVLLAIGFPIALVLAWAFEMTPEGMKRTDDLDEARPQRATVSKGRKLDFVIIGGLVLAVGFLFWRLNYGPVATKNVASLATTSAPTAEKPTSDVLPNSVAVLPFENLSPDPKDAYFAAGLHEEVLNQLSKIHSMSVISRSSVMQYAKEIKPVPDVARELHVGSVMEGSVQFANNRVKLTARLVDGKTGTDLWSDTYERPLDDVFKIEADIAMNVANALQAKFSPEEELRVEKPPTKSAQAYALMLKARSSGIAGNSDAAIPLLNQAVAIDPQFALARAAISYIQALKLINSVLGNAVPADQREAIETLSLKNAAKAIEIDPDVRLAHTALAIPALAHWRWSEADEAFSRALEVAPNDDIGRLLYGYLLSWTGRHDEAIALTKRGLDLDPNRPDPSDYASALGYAGRYAAAAAFLETTIARTPTDLRFRNWLAFMDVAAGNPTGAIEQLELSEKLAGGSPPVVYLPEWAYSYGRVGRQEDAKRLLKKIEAAAAKGIQPGNGGWAMAYLAIGDEKQALDWLGKAAAKAADHEPDESLFSLMNLRMNITNDPVLKKPEFVRVLSRIKGD